MYMTSYEHRYFFCKEEEGVIGCVGRCWRGDCDLSYIMQCKLKVTSFYK